MTQRDKLTERVAKLLRQAEDVAGTPEEAAFQARAFEIMAKYGLEMSFIQAAREGLDVSDMPRDAVEWVVVLGGGTYIGAQAQILMSMARALHCRSCYMTTQGWVNSDGKPGAKVWIYGMQHHIDRLQILWDLLRPQALRQVKTVKPGYYSDASTKVFRRSWLSGFANAVSSRITEQEDKAIESAGGGALVLYRSDTKAAKDALALAHPRLSNRQTKRQFSRDGYQAGQRAGRSASFNRALA